MLLEVKGLRTTFGSYRGEVHAVDGVSFSMRRNRHLGVVGESGCGKSVTGLSIMGLIQQQDALAQLIYAAGDEGMVNVDSSEFTTRQSQVLTQLCASGALHGEKSDRSFHEISLGLSNGLE